MQVNQDVECPYRDAIDAALSKELPGAATSREGQLEAITAALVGTKQYRYGPTPNPENLVSIRDVVRRAMDAGKAIRMLVPWGGSKQGDFGVDLAEVMALRQLVRVADAVKQWHEPGLFIRIRLEDLTDRLLFDERWYEKKTVPYVKDLMVLANIIAPDASVVRESDMVEYADFANLSNINHAAFKNAIALPEGIRPPVLRDIGWIGALPDEQINYYRRAYERFYPSMTEEERDALVARYFAISLSRKELNATGASMDVPWLTGAFAPPIPGAPGLRRLYYRTVCETYQSTHRAPYLGKGYLAIRGRDATPKVAGWDGDGLDYQKHSVTFSKLDTSVAIECDYVVEE